MHEDRVADYILNSLKDRLEKLENKLESQEKQIDLMQQLIEQLKGAGLFLRICFLIIGPLVGGLYWIKNHLH